MVWPSCKELLILFLIFCFLFLPSKKVQFGWKPLILPTLAIIGLMACQSRTIFLAYLILLFLYFILIQRDWRYIVYFSLFSSVIFTIFITNGNTYIESLGDASATQYSAISRTKLGGIRRNIAHTKKKRS